MTTMLVGEVLHGSDDDRIAWCGATIPGDALPWDESMEGTPTCPTCKAHDLDGAVAEAAALILEQPDTRAIAGPCGHLHMMGRGTRDPILISHLAAMPRGYRMVTPTPEQIVGLLIYNRRCDLCTPTRPGRE